MDHVGTQQVWLLFLAEPGLSHEKQQECPVLRGLWPKRAPRLALGSSDLPQEFPTAPNPRAMDARKPAVSGSPVANHPEIRNGSGATSARGIFTKAAASFRERRTMRFCADLRLQVRRGRGNGELRQAVRSQSCAATAPEGNHKEMQR